MKIERVSESGGGTRERKNEADEEKKKTVTQLIHSILLYIFRSLRQQTGEKEWLKLFGFDVKECDGNVCGFFVGSFCLFSSLLLLLLILLYILSIVAQNLSSLLSAFIIYSAFMHPFDGSMWNRV